MYPMRDLEVRRPQRAGLDSAVQRRVLQVRTGEWVDDGHAVPGTGVRVESGRAGAVAELFAQLQGERHCVVAATVRHPHNLAEASGAASGSDAVRSGRAADG